MPREGRKEWKVEIKIDEKREKKKKREKRGGEEKYQRGKCRGSDK